MYLNVEWVGVGLPVMLVALPIQVEGLRSDLLVGQVGVAGEEHFSTSRLLGSGSSGLLKALLDGVQRRTLQPVAANAQASCR